MKTILLFCKIFYGQTMPEYSESEQLLLSHCDQAYETEALCSVDGEKLKDMKHPDVFIFYSCHAKD